MQENNLKKEWIKFITVMIVFMAGMILLTIYGVQNWIFWLIYAAIWWIIEARIAKNIQLHWGVWVILIAALTGLDIWIIGAFS